VIVLDASAVLEFLLGTARGALVARRFADSDETLHAPHLLDLEVAQVLRRWIRSGEVSSTRAQQALDDLRDLDLARYAHDVLLPRIWELRDNATAYDAAYLALAEVLGAPLLTTDARLAKIRGVDARIDVIRDG
jgi:predicted nucleic acid-binding protein